MNFFYFFIFSRNIFYINEHCLAAFAIQMLLLYVNEKDPEVN